MYAKLVKLRYTWTAIAFLIIFTLVGIWYTQPTDIYGLDAKLEVESISIMVTHPGDGKNEVRSLELTEEDAAFGEVLEKVESMEFKRPFKNLLFDSSMFKKEAPTGDFLMAEGEFCVLVALSGPPEQVLTLICTEDHWEYRKSAYDADLPLKATENTEAPVVLDEYFWNLAE